MASGKPMGHPGHLCSRVSAVVSWGHDVTRDKLVHELKDKALLLFHRKLYKLAIKTLMGSWTLKSSSITSKITRRN